jgi:DNA-binding PadR family transcriptional regulator
MQAQDLGPPIETERAEVPAVRGRSAHDVSRPRVLIRPWVLLLLEEAPGHGYELVQRLRDLGFEWGTRGGPIYRELRLMADEDLVRSTLESGTVDGPMRNVYSLTARGRTELTTLVEAAIELSGLTTQLIDRHRTVTSRAR